jgi:hypothetical protein
MMYGRTRAYNRDLTPASDSTGFKSFFFLPAEFAGGGLETLLEEEGAAAAAAAAAANFVAAVAANFWAALPRAPFGGMSRDERLTTRGIIWEFGAEETEQANPNYIYSRSDVDIEQKKKWPRMAANILAQIGAKW